MAKIIESYEIAIAEQKKSLRELEQAGDWEKLKYAKAYLEAMKDEYNCLLSNDEELRIYLSQTGDVVTEIN